MRPFGLTRVHPWRVLSLALLLSVPQPAAADWVRVETPNFIVLGESSEGRVREVAGQFERFREALGRVIPGAATKAAVPTVVLVFDSRRSFEPYRPRFNGRPIEAGGFFVATPDQNLVALTIENREQGLRTVLHEYAHLVIANRVRNVPAWASEGLAEYYSTFDVRDDGKTAVLGRPIPEHLFLLRREQLIPQHELLAVDTSSPLYNEGERRSVFYAQSWALVHMLLRAGPERANDNDLERYINLCASGVSSDAAWSSVFGTKEINGEVRKYVNQDSHWALLYTFEQEIPAVRDAVSAPSADQVQAALANLLFHVQQQDEAVARLKQSLADHPESAHVRARLGLVQLERGERDEAERLLSAGTAGGDWLAQYYIALGLTELVESQTARQEQLAGLARRALAAVIAARPELPNALALRARIAAARDDGLDEALSDIRRARTLAPGREDYAFDEARIQAERRQFEEARRVLEPLLTSRYHTAVREMARTLMDDIDRVAASYREVELWRQSREAAEAVERRGATRHRGDDVPSVPVFRKLLAGEQRSEGLLERIECSRRQIILHVRTAGSLTRFAAARFEAVDFISYRDDLREPITCSPRTPADPVYVTWRAAPKATQERIAIAVEFLPKR